MYDNLGNVVQLGAQFRSGGEGIVYEVIGRPTILAKKYRIAPSPEKALKLRAMVELQSHDLIEQAAWPTATLADHRNGSLLGLLMPKIDPVDYIPIHELFSPSSRIKAVPAADWRFLIHVASNVSR